MKSELLYKVDDVDLQKQIIAFSESHEILFIVRTSDFFPSLIRGNTTAEHGTITCHGECNF